MDWLEYTRSKSVFVNDFREVPEFRENVVTGLDTRDGKNLQLSIEFKYQDAVQFLPEFEGEGAGEVPMTLVRERKPDNAQIHLWLYHTKMLNISSRGVSVSQ